MKERINNLQARENAKNYKCEKCGYISNENKENHIKEKRISSAQLNRITNNNFLLTIFTIISVLSIFCLNDGLSLKGSNQLAKSKFITNNTSNFENAFENEPLNIENLQRTMKLHKTWKILDDEPYYYYPECLKFNSIQNYISGYFKGSFTARSLHSILIFIILIICLLI